MIGYHAVSVIADAMAKGIKGFDYEKAYEAAKHSAELDRDGLAAYKKRGYISMEDENESVSKTLEYAYDDWCIAQMAAILIQRYEDGCDNPTRCSRVSGPEVIIGDEDYRDITRNARRAFRKSLRSVNRLYAAKKERRFYLAVCTERGHVQLHRGQCVGLTRSLSRRTSRV